LFLAQFGPPANIATAGVLLVGTVLMTRNRPNGTLNYAVTVLGVAFVGWFMAHAMLLVQLDAAPAYERHYGGTGYLIFLLAVLMLGDSGAYFVGSAMGAVIFGSLFALQTTAVGLVFCGVMITFCNAWLSFSYHSYQSELFPTNIRARAVGFCYSFSRLSTVFSSLLIGFILEHLGTPGVLAFIASSMLIVMITISWFGPRTRNLVLEHIAH
jgi:CDP-diglyceride synthetase